MKPYDPSEVPVNTPRFIPTLTEVVEYEAEAADQSPAAGDPPTLSAAQTTATACETLPLPEQEGAPSQTSESRFADAQEPAEPPAAIEPPAAAPVAQAQERPEGLSAIEAPVAAPGALPASAAVPMDLPIAFTDELVHRVMQKVDFVLAERIKESVNRIIEQQTRALIPRLHEELEFTVRKTIDEATSDVLLEILNKEPL